MILGGMAKKLLAIGDINVDIILGGLAALPVVDREITCESFELTMGSSAAIFACAYAGLGGQVSFLGLAGEDAYGDYMVRGLQEFGVGTDLVRRTTQVKTGVTVNLIYGSTRSQVTYPGTIASFSGDDIDESVLRGFDHLHLAGPYQQTRFRPCIARLLGLARNLGLSTSLDPQWDATEQWDGLSEWMPLLSYLFVNRDEAQSISGQADLAECVGWLAERTLFPIVKLGPEGVALRSDGELLCIPSYPVEVADTTGAGDTFDAAFLFAVNELGVDHAQASNFGTAAAARSCRFVGGVSSRSSRADVVAFAREYDRPLLFTE
jgi:ribokinase